MKGVPKAVEKKKMTERAKEIKEEGNEHYKVGRLDEALTCYRKAAALQPDDPVYHSNISAVLYEVGRYNESINSIMHALALLTDSSNPPLESRLLLRKAKAFFYMHKFKEGSQIMEELEELCTKKGVVNPDADGATRSALQRASANLIRQEHPMPFHIFRSPVRTSTKEYSTTTHETPTSVFSGYLSSTQAKAADDIQSLDPQDRYQHRQKFHEAASGRMKLNSPLYHQFSFLCGGVGGARNVLASFHDIGASFKSGTRAVNPITKFHFTLVDVKASAIARSLVVFYLLKHLAAIPPKRQSNDLNAIELIAVLQYMLLATIMPPYLSVRLNVVMRELKRDIQEEHALPKWILVHSESVPEIVKCLDFWIDFKVTGKEMYNRTANFQRRSQKKTNEETPRQKVDKMTEEELDKFIIQGTTNNQQKRDTIRLALEFQLFDEEEVYLMGTQTEGTLYAHTKLLSPPHMLLKRHPQFETFYRLNKAIQDRVMIPEDLTFSFKELVDDALETWQPNPTMCDQESMELAEQAGGFTFDHHFFLEGHFLFYPLAHPHNPCSLYDYAYDYFTRVAMAIARLGNGSFQIVVECVVAEMYSFAFEISHGKKQLRIERGLPHEFDRIHLSSIPDSTGGNLSASSVLMPMLKALPHAEISYAVSEHKNNCESLQEWLQTYTYLTQDTHDIYLGMKYLSGNLWGDNVRWAPVIPAFGKLATQDDLTLWLYRIFLFIVLPNSVEGEPFTDCSLNLVVFIHLLVRLAGIGYPTHWLGIVLDSLLSGKIKTKARPPPNALNPHYPHSPISTKPFLADLESAVLSNQQFLPFRLFSSHLPYPLVQVTVDVKMTPSGDGVAAPVVSVLFGTLQDLMAMKPYDLRESLVSGRGESQVAIYSNVVWNSETKEMKMWIPKNRLEEMVRDEWHFAPIRVDHWLPVGMPQLLKPK